MDLQRIYLGLIHLPRFSFISQPCLITCILYIYSEIKKKNSSLGFLRFFLSFLVALGFETLNLDCIIIMESGQDSVTH